MDSRENHLRPNHCSSSSAKTAPANLIGDLRDGKTCTTRLRRWIGYTILDSFMRYGRYPRRAGRDGRVRSRPVDPTAPDQRHQRNGLQPVGRQPHPRQERIIEPGRENRRLKMEVDALKQAALISAQKQPR